MTKHRHVWGPRTGIGRLWALAIARGWVDLCCVECGKPKGNTIAAADTREARRG